MTLVEVYGGQRGLAFELTTANPTALIAIQQECFLYHLVILYKGLIIKLPWCELHQEELIFRVEPHLLTK